MTKIKKDKYKKARGGWSRILKLSCAKCGTYLFDYQKDGAGILKRLYKVLTQRKLNELIHHSQPQTANA